MKDFSQQAEVLTLKFATFAFFKAKLPNLKLKTHFKQLLGYLPSHRGLPRITLARL
jgi:hypothetical protein